VPCKASKQGQYMLGLHKAAGGTSASQQPYCTVSSLVIAFAVKAVLVKAIPTSTNQEEVTRDDRRRWQGPKSGSH